MGQLHLYRKRIIPMECVLLTDDEILFRDKERIVTRWHTLKPKKELDHGLSCYYLEKGFKVSKFMRKDGSLLYWYCDIVTHTCDPDTDTYVFTDLLADVVIYPDASVRVIDLDETGQALKDGLITKEQCVGMLNSLSSLLDIIYAGSFPEMQRYLESFE